MAYHYLEAEDIHEIHLKQATHRTMGEFFQLISRLYATPPVSGVTRILIVQKGAALPLSSFINETRTFISQRRRMPHTTPTSIAVVIEKTSLLHFVSQLLKVMKHQDEVRFFDLHEHDAAVTWLKR